MSWVEYDRRIKDKAIVFLPVGALEQHGPHLPMGTDAVFATRMAEAVAERLDGVVLPPVNYGYKSQARSGGGQTFIGTTSLDGAHLIGITRDIVRELARHGVQKLVVVDGHFENQWFLTEAIELAQRELGQNGQRMRVLRTEYWEFCPPEVLDAVFDGAFPGFDLEHAALIETSMMLHWHPEWVDIERVPIKSSGRFPAYDSYPQDGRGVPASGVLSPAEGASADKGRIIIEATVARMTEALGQAFDA
jgi:creatinine amidohydrolase